jgi:hypothetical protein
MGKKKKRLSLDEKIINKINDMPEEEFMKKYKGYQIGYGVSSGLSIAVVVVCIILIIIFI